MCYNRVENSEYAEVSDDQSLTQFGACMGKMAGKEFARKIILDGRSPRAVVCRTAELTYM